MEKSNQSAEQILYQQLQDLGIVNNNTLNNNEHIQNQLQQLIHDNDTPWFINLFLGFCGLLSGFFLLGFG